MATLVEKQARVEDFLLENPKVKGLGRVQVQSRPALYARLVPYTRQTRAAFETGQDFLAQYQKTKLQDLKRHLAPLEIPMDLWADDDGCFYVGVTPTRP